MTNAKTISFHRNYFAYSGGHQKVHDYLRHTLSHSGFSASLYLNNRSVVKKALFDNIEGLKYQDHYQPSDSDIVFLAGMDWDAYFPFFDDKQPKINLVQHIRHGDKKHPLFQFLKHRAVRLCVSEAVRSAIEPYANGPCITIKMGHSIPKIKTAKSNDLYILATKQPMLGGQVASWAREKGLAVVIHDKPVESYEVSMGMASSRVSIVLPNKTEGFYLPGIEAMALSDWAVVPDCIASREYTLDKANISSCSLEFDSCIQTISDVLSKLKKWNVFVKKWRGKNIFSGYALDEERRAFKQILSSVDNLWT